MRKLAKEQSKKMKKKKIAEKAATDFEDGEGKCNRADIEVGVQKHAHEATEFRHGQREVSEVFVEQEDEEHTGGEYCAESDGAGVWEAAAGGAGGEVH
ncbi:hypothetical protein MTO96_043389 [Rhipicephalus appendiculatus]